MGMPSLSPLSSLDSFQYIWRGLIFGEGMVKSDMFLCLPVDGPITGGGVLMSGSLRYRKRS